MLYPLNKEPLRMFWRKTLNRSTSVVTYVIFKIVDIPLKYLLLTSKYSTDGSFDLFMLGIFAYVCLHSGRF